MLVRNATPADAGQLALVFFDAVRKGPSPYSPAERIAWMPNPPEPAAFTARLEAVHTVLVEEAGRAVGFMTVEAGGYIDLAFILAEYRGQGAFRMLCTEVEAAAREWGEPRLWTHASLMAQPAFQAVGFRVIQHETVERAGEALARAEMEKPLR